MRSGHRVLVTSMVTRPFRGTGQTFREHGERHAQWVGFSGRSRGVIRTCQSGFGEGDLGSGKPLDHAHGAVAVRAWPGSKLAGQRCSSCLQGLVEEAAADRQQLSAFTVGEPTEVADAGEASGLHLEFLAEKLRPGASQVISASDNFSVPNNGRCVLNYGMPACRYAFRMLVPTRIKASNGLGFSPNAYRISYLKGYTPSSP